MEVLAAVAQREGFARGYGDGWRSGRDAILRALGPGGRRDVLEAIEREAAAWAAIERSPQMAPPQEPPQQDGAA